MEAAHYEDWFERNFWPDVEPNLRDAIVSRGVEGDAVDQIVAAVKRHSKGMPWGLHLDLPEDVLEQVKLPVWRHAHELLSHFLNQLLDIQIELHLLKQQIRKLGALDARENRKVLQ